MVVIVICGIANDATSKTTTYTKTAEERYVELALTNLRARLRDPSSLQVHSVTAYKDIEDNSIAYIIIDAGAKNGFGGMGRDLYLYSSMGLYITNDSEKEGKKKISEVMTNKQYKSEKIYTGRLNY